MNPEPQRSPAPDEITVTLTREEAKSIFRLYEPLEQMALRIAKDEYAIPVKVTSKLRSALDTQEEE